METTLMKRFADLLREAATQVPEVMPWTLRERLDRADEPAPILLDVREPAEFEAAHIPGSISVPRGVLEAACDWDYGDTVPELARGHDREIIVICRSGNRSLLAAQVMMQMGFGRVASLKTGVRGWNDFEQPLVDAQDRPVDIDQADTLLASVVRPDQRRPA
jgi:rhodanese-related sulfurtransferase